MLLNYTKFAFRNLTKNKVFSIVNIAGLSVGIAAVIIIGLWIQDEYSYDRFNKNYKSIYRITETQKQETGLHPVAMTPGPLAESLVKEYSEIEQILRIGQQGGLIQNGNNKYETYNMLAVDPSFFSMFDYPLLEGQKSNIFSNPDEIILTEKAASILFGNNWQSKDIIGKEVKLNSFQNFSLKISAVAQNLPVNSHIQADVFLPFKLLEKYDEWSMKWGGNSFHTYVQLSEKTDALTFATKIKDVLIKYKDDKDTKLFLQPLSEIYLHYKFDFNTDWGKRSDIFYIYLFLIVGFIILLIAIFNFVNLATAKGSQRGKEVGVRKMVGANASNLVNQFLVESLIIVFLAIAIAHFISLQFLPYISELSSKHLTIPSHSMSYWSIIAIFGFSVALLAGIYPAFVLSKFSPQKAIKSNQNISTGKNLRNTLVIGQFTLSIILVASTITIYKQLQFIQNKNLGFEKDHLLYVRLKGDSKAKAFTMRDEISKLSSIKSVTATTNNLVNVGNESNIEWEGQKGQSDFLVTQINTDPDFIETINAKIIAGRNFSKNISRDTSDIFGSYMLNETAARKMGWTNEQAIGKKVKFWGFEGEVVGIVNDFHFRPLNQSIAPLIIRYRPKESYHNLVVNTSSNHIPSSIEVIKKIYSKYESEYPLDYGFVKNDLETQYTNDTKTGNIFLLFAFLAILVSCLGLLGLILYSIEQKVKEIGIRKVMGASVLSIAVLLIKNTLILISISILIATPITSYIMNYWLLNFAYKISFSYVILIQAGAIAIIVSLLTVSIQAIRAATRNPINSLRSE